MQHDPELIAEVRAWLLKAERDLAAGNHDLTAERPLTEDAVVPLTMYAWKFRYPGDEESPSYEESEQALGTARQAFDSVMTCLPSEARP